MGKNFSVYSSILFDHFPHLSLTGHSQSDSGQDDCCEPHSATGGGAGEWVGSPDPDCPVLTLLQLSDQSQETQQGGLLLGMYSQHFLYHKTG